MKIENNLIESNRSLECVGGRQAKEKEKQEELLCNLQTFQMLIKKNLYSLVKVILSDLLPAEKYNNLPSNYVNM